jgi:hypothetical protein
MAASDDVPSIAPVREGRREAPSANEYRREFAPILAAG